jgi:hypothetical protein
MRLLKQLNILECITQGTALQTEQLTIFLKTFHTIIYKLLLSQVLFTQLL